MNKLQLITAHLLGLKLFSAEQLDSYAENVLILPSGKNEGLGIVLARITYDATISVENFNGDADVLVAHLTLWLMEQCAIDNDNLPRLDVEPVDDNLVDVEITIPFDETINLVPDPAGPFTYQGETWQLVAAVPVDVAEQGDVEKVPND